MAESLVLKWKRPESLEYPKVWHTFKARDLDSDKLVEYQIQDLPLERVDEIFDFMFKNYIVDEPIGQVLGMIFKNVCQSISCYLNWNSFQRQRKKCRTL